VLKFILDILSVPAILIGLVSFIGLVVQKKGISDVLKGSIKTVMGVLILGGGAGLAVTALGHFGTMFQYGFGITGVVPHNEAIVGMALETYGTQTALIMAFGMVANVLIARFTPLKFIFLTGHHTLYMACMIGIILTVGGFEGATLVAVGAVILGLVMAVFPAIAHPVMKKISGSDDVAFGHFGTVGYVFAAYVGKLLGNKEQSTEDINFPQGLAFLRDSSLAISLVMLVLFLIVALACGPEYVEKELSGGQNFLVFSILQAITFAGGVYVILAGVRLILAEIVPAFTGIATTLVPNAKPAIDCPVVFPFAPNAVLIGFLSSFVGGVIGMGILLMMGTSMPWLPIILPSVVPHFFCGATAGVFGNATGGLRGCIFGAMAHGLLITFLPILLMPVLGNLGFANTTFSDADFCVVGTILGNVINLIK
jgi:PTS system ascorbate-specific IIC component